MYQRVLAEEGDTFADVASRLGNRANRGSGLYRLVKTENVSAQKKLVLFNLTSETFETADVRQRLGVNGKAKSVSIKPTQVPDGYELYVQSTSPNRKLPSGYVLLEGNPSEIAATSGQLSTKPPPAKKRKRSDEQDEEEEEDIADDDNAHGGGLVDWKLLEGLQAADDGIDEAELVKRPGDLEFCDEKVPEDVLHRTQSDMLLALTSVSDWRELQILTMPNGSGVKLQWQSQKSNARLLYFFTSDLAIIAMELPGKCGVVYGVGGGHPFIQTNRFGYGNSDGSSDFRPIPGKVTPQQVIVQLMSDVWYHGHDSVH